MAVSVCSYGFIPVRSHPSERAQLETQILFGESYETLEYSPGWWRVKCHYDGYEGWIDEKLMTKMNEQEVKSWNDAAGVLVSAPFAKAVKEPETSVQILTAGSRVVFNGPERNSFNLGACEYYWQGALPARRPDIEETARAFLNAPYLWGGRTFFGIDCSGLVQVVFKLAGVALPRNASQQIHNGSVVAFVEEARIGDLAYFDNEQGDVTHVGICLQKGRVLHASGSVRIDTLDHQGIYNHQKRSYTHRLREIKRVTHE